MVPTISISKRDPMDLRWPQWLQHGYKQLTGNDIVDNIDTSEISNSIDETNVTGNVDAEPISDNDILPGWPHDGDNCDEDMPTFTKQGAEENDNEDMPTFTNHVAEGKDNENMPHIPTPEDVAEYEIVKRDASAWEWPSFIKTPYAKWMASKMPDFVTDIAPSIGDVEDDEAEEPAKSLNNLAGDKMAENEVKKADKKKDEQEKEKKKEEKEKKEKKEKKDRKDKKDKKSNKKKNDEDEETHPDLD
ncbi:Protein of unknown function [Pyronema omphalodes CBS 100304]|uniref:Uncharacterized protein n=1 Tax=Pyronema omphalodes (strain CBS 100304) TaxID=1076935 RepID=U4L0R6_PYROM|nr:Protein of unknown function [Pyronema omphalodes CBS 100304]